MIHRRIVFLKLLCMGAYLAIKSLNKKLILTDSHTDDSYVNYINIDICLKITIS